MLRLGIPLGIDGLYEENPNIFSDKWTFKDENFL